jgi:E3 ubiquitin-protein ligase MYCBP2
LKTGRLLGIKDRIVKVALGKAHGVTLTDKGVVYTFGINNKGQCGRDLFSSSQTKQSENNSQLQSTTLLSACKEPIDDEIESEDSGSATEMKVCAADEHHWSVDQCMVCTQCGQCTVSLLFYTM